MKEVRITSADWFGKEFKKKSFVSRYTRYIIATLFLLFASFWIVGLAIENIVAFFHLNLEGKYIISPHADIYIQLALIVGLAGLMPFLVELGIWRIRKKHGIPMWKNATEDFKRVGIENDVKRVVEAKKKFGINEDSSSDSVDKSDIRYWHGLLKDGIISQEEFNKKKSELI